jgi:ribosomal protein L2
VDWLPTRFDLAVNAVIPVGTVVANAEIKPNGAIAAGASVLLMTEKDAANWPDHSLSAVPSDPFSSIVGIVGIVGLVGRIEFRCREVETLKALLRTGRR